MAASMSSGLSSSGFSLAPYETKNLPDLPTEIIWKITDLLDSYTLCSLRLTCKSLAEDSYRAFTKKHPTETTCTRSDRLPSFLDTLDYRRVADSVTHVTLTAGSIASSIPIYGNYNLQEIWYPPIEFTLPHLTSLTLANIEVDGYALCRLLHQHRESLRELRLYHVAVFRIEEWRCVFRCMYKHLSLDVFGARFLVYSAAATHDLALMLPVSTKPRSERLIRVRGCERVRRLLRRYFDIDGRLHRDVRHNERLDAIIKRSLLHQCVEKVLDHFFGSPRDFRSRRARADAEQEDQEEIVVVGGLMTNAAVKQGAVRLYAQFTLTSRANGRRRTAHLNMPFFARFKRSIAHAKTPCALGRDNGQHTNANLAQVPDEILEMITSLLDRRGLCSLRLCCKRLALVTTYQVTRFCPRNRACVNATYSLKILIEGSRLPLLNDTITSLTLSAPSWKSPLARYGEGLREVHLLRLTSLYLDKINIIKADDLHHFLASHTASLREIHMTSVHLPNLQSWEGLLGCIVEMSLNRLHSLELRMLFYSVPRARGQTRDFILPRSSYDCRVSSANEFLSLSGTEEECRHTAHQRHEIGRLLAGFYTEDGDLKKDSGHEQLLAEEGEEEDGWMQSMIKKLTAPRKTT
ncbi:hypothetical protein Q7P37_006767 [Cladosporium fusiforme]